MQKVKFEKCSLCGKNLLKDSFNGRTDVGCPPYFFGGKGYNQHDHYTPKI